LNKENRSVLANLIRETGHMAKILRYGTRMRFEEIFVSVANFMLPKNHFLKIVEQTRKLWREDGFGNMTPGLTRKAAKSLKHKKSNL